jgi:hypothetical protein
VKTWRWENCPECFGRGQLLTPLYVARLADKFEIEERERRMGRRL